MMGSQLDCRVCEIDLLGPPLSLPPLWPRRMAQMTAETSSSKAHPTHKSSGSGGFGATLKAKTKLTGTKR
jgi:hypothetical protein